MACQTTLSAEKIGKAGMMSQYIKHVLSERRMCTRIGKTYSSIKNIDIGIPQGSIIAPILITILIHDLPKALSNNTHVAHFAYDIVIWANTTLRTNKNKRMVNYAQKVYQSELNKLIILYEINWS